MALTWTQKYSVGVREIDDHNKQLFSLLNTNLKHVIDETRESKTIAADLKKLREYAVSHFKVEEDLFLKINFPDAAEHIHEHEEFRKELQKLDALTLRNDDLARLKLLLFLSTWFSKHILTTDKKYIPYLTEK